MRTIYIDEDYKCFLNFKEEYTIIQTDYFDDINYWTDNKIESMRFVPEGEEWIREDGSIFYGQMVTPWKILEE